MMLFLSEDTEGDVKVHHLLTLLLRLRQITCHPYLINGMIDQEARSGCVSVVLRVTILRFEIFPTLFCSIICSFSLLNSM